LVKFELVDGGPVLTWYHAGNHIDHYAERPMHKTYTLAEGITGDRREVLDSYDPSDDTYWYRYLLQLVGTGGAYAAGKPIIKPLGVGVDPDEFHRIEFRMVSERETFAQIKVKGEPTADALTVEGNDVWHNVVFQECNLDPEGEPVVKGVIAIRDGLSSWHADTTSAPPVPGDRTLETTTYTYANCHCCGEGA